MMPSTYHKNCSTDNKSDKYIDYTTNSDYFIALRDDDVEKCQSILNNTTTPDKFIFGKFKYPEIDPELQTNHTSLLCHPLSLASVYGSFNVVKWLLEAGVQPEIVKEERVGNIFHCIAQFHSLNCTKYNPYAMVQLLNVSLSLENVHKLMLDDMEDHGLRPMELAFRFGAYKLARQMINLGHVYLTEHVQRGLVRHCRYDLTEYHYREHELLGRKDKSPIQFIRYIPTKFVKTLMESGLLNDPLMVKWMNQRVMYIKFYVSMFLWFILRNLSCPLFLFDLERVNKYVEFWNNITRSHRPGNMSDNFNYTAEDHEVFRMERNVIIGLMIIPFLLRLISFVDVLDFVLRRRRIISRLLPSGSLTDEHLFISGKFYKLTRFIADWAAISVYIQVFWNIALETNLHDLKNYMSIWFIMFAISNLYFIEILCPFFIARHVILLRYSTIAFLTVSFIFFYWLYFFAKLFEVCLVGQYPQHFSTVFTSIYTANKIFLNMLEFKGIDDTNLMLVHLLFIMIIGVCLINTMIALMTERMNDVSCNLETYYTVQRLDAILRVDDLSYFGQKLIHIVVKRCYKMHSLVIWVELKYVRLLNKEGNYCPCSKTV